MNMLGDWLWWSGLAIACFLPAWLANAIFGVFTETIAFWAGIAFFLGGLALYLNACLFTVSQAERHVLERFGGKFLRIAQPGLNVALLYGLIDKTARVVSLRQKQVSLYEDESQRGAIELKDGSKVQVHITVWYKVIDIRNPEETRWLPGGWQGNPEMDPIYLNCYAAEDPDYYMENLLDSTIKDVLQPRNQEDKFDLEQILGLQSEELLSDEAEAKVPGKIDRDRMNQEAAKVGCVVKSIRFENVDIPEEIQKIRDQKYQFQVLEATTLNWVTASHRISSVAKEEYGLEISPAEVQEYFATNRAMELAAQMAKDGANVTFYGSGLGDLIRSLREWKGGVK